MTTDVQLVVNHLLAAVWNGTIMLPMTFGLGVVAGWSVCQWRDNHIGAVVGAGVALAAFVWLTWVWYRTRGLMHKPD
jgi:hypothetical protein